MERTQRRNVKVLNLTAAELKPATMRAEDICGDSNKLLERRARKISVPWR